MSKKKSLIKKSLNFCFSCGVELDIDNKNIHRINQNKNITKNNIVILCTKCKYRFSLGGLKIYLENICREVLDKYFENQDKNYKKIILKSLQFQRDNYEDKENE